jgi:hypothetical protein
MHKNEDMTIWGAHLARKNQVQFVYTCATFWVSKVAITMLHHPSSYDFNPTHLGGFHLIQRFIRRDFKARFKPFDIEVVLGFRPVCSLVKVDQGFSSGC